MDQAEVRWRAFFNDETPHPGPFEQHLLIFDLIKDTTITGLPNNFNRFMAGAVALDIVGSNESLMTFAKLGRFMIFGIIQKGSQKWEGTKVHVRHGMIKPGKFLIPPGLMDLFCEKAEHTSAAMDAISPTQRAKIDKHIIDNLEDFVETDQFAAIAADARMFGESAVVRKN